jgi:hypothetical protein
MAKHQTLRVYPNGNVWVVKKDGAIKASTIKYTKEEALQAARAIAINQGLSITIHGRDGKIQRTVRPQETSDKDGCFITTACVKYYGLSNNCYQLETLRKFRDTYLLNSSKNRVLVKQYYSIAPSIVKLIESDKNKRIFFRDIFNKINEACAAIENNEPEKAKIVYKSTVMRLINHFNIL